MQGTKKLLTAAAFALFVFPSLVSCGGGGGDSGRVVNVTGVSLNKPTLNLGVNEQETLVAMVMPSNATNQGIAWSSDDMGVAGVTSGRVTGVGVGTARITATTENGGHRAHCDVSVGNIAVTGVSLDKASIMLAQGGIDVLVASVQPSNATNSNVSWSSSNPDVAMVGSGGIVTALASGVAAITVTTQDGGKTAVCAVQVATVPVADVSLNKASLTLSHGDSETLVATVMPSNATNNNVSWSSSNPNIAAVGAGGLVMGVSPGGAVVVVTTQDGGRTATCAIAVMAVPVTGVSLNKASLAISHGGSEALAATVQPSNATNKNVSWASSNPNVAAVGAGGLVTGVSPGGATITVATQDGGCTATCAVQVAAVPAAGVSLNKTSLAISHGGSEALAATVLPNNATNKNVSWSSNNAGVVSVDGGLVTAVSPGSAAVTVATEDGGWTATCAVTVTAVPVTGVSLNKTSLALAVANSETLVAIVQPSNATNKNVSWSSSNPNVAAVSAGGLLTGVSPGGATITVATHDGGFTATCAVQVAVVPAAGVSLNKASLALDRGSSETLVAMVQPSDATNKGVSWLSSAPGIASVSSGGLVAAVAVGTAVITVTTQDGGWTATCAVTVTVPVTGVTLGRSTLDLNPGGSYAITATVQPSDATNKAVSWSSSNANIAMVDSGGLVTAASNGTAMVTATTADGGKTATCAVTVTTPVAGVTLPETLSVPRGTQAQLAVTVLPESASNKDVIWETSNGNATLSATTGLTVTVTGAFIGDTAVKVTTADGGKMATCTVTVARPVAGATVSGGSDHTLAIKADGSLWAWGSNEYGQLGTGGAIGLHAPLQLIPAQVGTANDWVAVSAGYVHSMALKADGSLWAWGRAGSLGIGDVTTRNIPVQVGTANDWVAVSSGTSYTLAIKRDGSLWAWGSNEYGQLGTGDATGWQSPRQLVPVQVGTDNDWAMVSTGSRHTLAIKVDGSLWGWGWNEAGQTGANVWVGINPSTPVRVGTAVDWATVSGGYNHSVALRADSGLWVWGYMVTGLSQGNIITSPVQMGTAKDWATLSASSYHTLALKADGYLWAWGRNDYGCLGVGDNASRFVLVQVGTDNDWAVVSAGRYHTLAIKADGSLWAWGSNEYGQLGDGTTKDRYSPVQVGTGFRLPTGAVPVASAASNGEALHPAADPTPAAMLQSPD